MRLLIASVVGLSLAAMAANSWAVDESTPGWFAFTIPGLDTSETFVDMSSLNAAPAGDNGRVVVKDGQFVDGKGKRVRLLGTNLTFAGALPSKEQAPAIAGHLRKLGFNIIRFHHIDGATAPRALWNKDHSVFDPEMLDRLDWLIHQLKEHGVYTNLNLHVSRTYPGMPKSGTYPRAFRYGKGLDNFHRPFIELQKQYARDLLTHRNPYTKTTYAEETAVMVVELNNENSLTNVKISDLRNTPEPYMSDLVSQWRAWIKQRYGTTDKLRQEWNAEDVPLGKEMLRDDDFADLSPWQFQASASAEMKTEVINGASGRVLKVNGLKVGDVSWSLQFHHSGLDFEEDKIYTISFRARADRERPVALNARLDREPWGSVGLDERLTLDKEWRDHTFTFRCKLASEQHGRVGLNLINELGVIEVADFSVRPGGLFGLPKNQSIEANSIPLPPTNAGEAQLIAFAQFQSDTECAYVDEMMDLLRNELKVDAAICDTQDSYGGALGVYREATRSDFIDMHGYWQHPQWLGTAWDRTNWRIPNTSMIAEESGGTLGQRAWYRVKGMPFTVSEYDHPAPSDYSAEMYGMLASFAAFQDWDGVYPFSYMNNNVLPEEEQHIRTYFDQHSHPCKMAFAPVAAVMLRLGAVAAGSNPLVMELPKDAMAKVFVDHGRDPGPVADLLAASMERPVALHLGDAQALGVPIHKAKKRRVSNTGEIVWDLSDPKRPCYTVNAPAVRFAAGVIGGREIALGDVSIKVTKAENDFAAIAVCALDAKPIAESDRVLVVVAGRAENSGMKWNEDRTSVGTNWGHAPTVVEGVEATIQVPGGKKVQALNGRGAPMGDVNARIRGNRIEFQSGAKHETLWYAVSK